VAEEAGRAVVVVCRECGAERILEFNKYTGVPSLKAIAAKLRGLRCPRCGREYGEPELASVTYRGSGARSGGRP
jgi:ssDNA-binding Zn-finger/Zn-ribbon topoisomerase 1